LTTLGHPDVLGHQARRPLGVTTLGRAQDRRMLRDRPLKVPAQ
jgi:hypothetical protein